MKWFIYFSDIGIANPLVAAVVPLVVSVLYIFGFFTSMIAVSHSVKNASFLAIVSVLWISFFGI